ncbi:MAG: response regulator [Caldilineaceae bacterium]|nr:response regulator [Caldilineaceae bacterium]MBP8106947.1 response regulator [Caldilineaceae bacterium]MBP8121761.1 response regulator [Caldilineaceae bacterium]MBP9072387.1 response regulator [Caldilineaceae bacterium]
MTRTRILLADDHALVRAGIRNALAEAPDLDIVGEVGDGPGLFEALAQMPVDALLLDVTMPDFDPIAAIRQIRATYPQLKILVVSAYDDDTYVQGLLGAGVNGYHLKDQSLADLRLAVQRVLAGEIWISSRLVDRLIQFNSEPRSPQAPVPSSGSPKNMARLTLRQREILSYLQEGLDNQAIARRLGLSVKTVENHLTRLYRQLNVQSRLEAVSYANQSPDVVAFSGWEMGKEVGRREDHRGEPGEEVTILLVDDNWRYRRQLCRMVGKAYPDAAIYEADCIQAAVSMAQQVTPRLALVDVVLGDEDGIQCTRRLKAIQPTMRVILISAYPDREFHRRGVEAGVVAFLDKKDLDAETLRQVIQDVAV